MSSVASYSAILNSMLKSLKILKHIIQTIGSYSKINVDFKVDYTSRLSVFLFYLALG